MSLSPGAKVGLVAVAGIGAFLLAGGGGGSAKAATSAPPIDPCLKTPPDCASLTACVGKLLPIATKADVPDLQKVSAVAKGLGCTDLVKQIDAKIAELSKSGGGGGGGTTTTTVGKFSPSTVKDKQRLVNDAWTIAKMGPEFATSEDVAKYNLATNGTFKTPGDAIVFSYTGRPVWNVEDGKRITRPLSVIITDMQSAAGITADGKWGKQTSAAWSWGLANGGPTSIGSEGLRHNHRVRAGVGSESVAGCSACDAAGGEIANPESFGPYNTMPAHDAGYVKFDRAFGSQFGAGPSNGPLSKSRVFGRNSFWGGGSGPVG